MMSTIRAAEARDRSIAPACGPFCPRSRISSSKQALISSPSYQLIKQPGPQLSASFRKSPIAGICSASLPAQACWRPRPRVSNSNAWLTNCRAAGVRSDGSICCRNLRALRSPIFEYFCRHAGIFCATFGYTDSASLSSSKSCIHISACSSASL